LLVRGGLAFAASVKAESLADFLEDQIHLVKYPSSPAVIETVDEAMLTYEYGPASEPKIAIPLRSKGPSRVSRLVNLRDQTASQNVR
jgi:hypothetical protein